MSTTVIKGALKETKFKALKKGSILSETQYYKVDEIKGDKVRLINDNGDGIVVPSEYVNNCLNSADFYGREEKKNRTELIQLFVSNPYTAMTVCFHKKVDEKKVLEQLMNTHQNTAPKDVEKEFKKALKAALEGEKRVAEGRHYGHTDDFGRYQFVDMNKEKGTSTSYDGRQILVDARTIEYLIVHGVKYSLK